MDNVRILKLSSGENIIAKVIEKIDDEGERGWILEKPHLMILSREGLAMVPLTPFAKDDKITVRTDHISYSTLPIVEVLNYYKELISEIVLPQNGGLVLP